MTIPRPPGAQAERCCGCPDLALSRRRLLGGIAAGTGVLTATSLFGDAFRQVAYGAEADGNVVVVLSLRGGADGLSIVVPKNGTDQGVLARERPDLAVPVAQLVGGDGDWGLHPALAPLVAMWDAGRFGAVHGVGLPAPNRSHFDAMAEVEKADPGSSARVGWINRAVGLDPDALPEEQVQLGDSMLPTSLTGPAAALGAGTVQGFALPTVWNDEQVTASLRKVWGGSGTSLTRGVTTALSAVGRLSTLSGISDADLQAAEATYPDGPLRSVLANTALLVKARLGARMITIDYGDWDMHTGLGQARPGDWMHDHLAHLAGSLVRFFADLGADAARVTVVTLSEFGRRVAQNGSGADSGVDHGYGNAMLLLGAGVNGGAVRGRWTHLDSLTDGDVALSQDYRSVLAEVLASRFGISGGQLGRVFPGFSPEVVGSMV